MAGNVRIGVVNAPEGYELSEHVRRDLERAANHALPALEALTRDARRLLEGVDWAGLAGGYPVLPPLTFWPGPDDEAV